MRDTNSILKSIGKEIFVKYYQEFKDLNIDKEVLAKRLLNENPKAYKISGQYIRISNARIIFKETLQVEALEIIISSSKLDEDILKRAKELLKNEQNNQI
jgi:hypothetical protein